MNHIREEQFVLYYYGEEADRCRRSPGRMRILPRELSHAAARAELGRQPAGSGAQRRLRSAGVALGGAATAAAQVVRVAMAYVETAVGGGGDGGAAGRRLYRGADGFAEARYANAADSQVRERVLLVAVGDHLERSQTVLVELANAGAPKNGRLDISYEQQAAEDLLESNRLYRQTAASTGDTSTADMLEELERMLLEIAHSPSAVSEKQLDALRKQIEDRGIIFKVKVFGSQVEQRQAAPSNGNNGASL